MLHGALLARMRLKHLHLMAALAARGNMHRAASDLNVSQPAATKSLQDLESMLGVPLFTRGNAGMVMNEIGLYVHAYAIRMLNETDRFRQGLDSMKVGGAGTLAVGAVLASSPRLLPLAISELKSVRPLVRIKVAEDSSDRLLKNLEQNQYELVLARFTEPHHSNDFDMVPLNDEPLSVFAAANHPILKQKTIGLSELVDFPWVIQPPSSPTRQIIDQAFASQVGRFPADIVETASILMTLHLVLGSQAISILPSAILEGVERPQKLRAIKLRLEGMLPPFGIVTRKGESLSENATLFIDAIKRSVTLLNDA